MRCTEAQSGMPGSSLRQILRWVPTHANNADPSSREDFTIAKQLQWPILEPPTSRLLETTKKIIGDSRFAHQIGFTQDPYILQFQSLSSPEDVSNIQHRTDIILNPGDEDHVLIT